jgi:hypothetical protein
MKNELTDYAIGAFVFAMLLIIYFLVIDAFANAMPNPETKAAIQKFKGPLLIFNDFPDVELYLIILGVVGGAYFGHKCLFPQEIK